MDTQVAVVGRAVKAEVDGERDRRPCLVLCAAVETDLVGLLPSQLLEDGVRLGLCCHSHDGRVRRGRRHLLLYVRAIYQTMPSGSV